MKRVVATSLVALVAAAGLAGCGSSSKAKDAGTTSAAEAKSAKDFGGMDALIAAAKKEGKLNVITLPHDWANYGEILKAFSTKYGITLDEANPDGSSQDEINAVKSLKGQDRAPDVLDLGGAFAQQAAKDGLLASYQVSTWGDIPADQKDATGAWAHDYGGYVSIGCDTKKVAACPQTFADLLKPEYKGKVALKGDPTKAGAGFAAVYAASLANGGTLDNIQPGIDFFGKLKKNGNYLPVEAKPATIETGETPIVVNWDYLNAGYTDEVAAKGVDWKVVVPADGKYANFYCQAINKAAPHPAAARLWEEFLYSDEGQNLWLKGYARPVRLAKLTEAKTADPAALAKLPKVDGKNTLPTPEQIDAAKKVLNDGWSKAMTG